MLYKLILLIALVAAFSNPSVQIEEAGTVLEPKPIGKCPPPRFLPDGNDCRVYYECANGEPLRRECPEGQCFSRGKKGCE